MRQGLLLFFLSFILSFNLLSQDDIDYRSNNFADSKRYIIYKASQSIIIDGKADDPDWESVPFTDDFVDIEGIVTPYFKTRVKMLWDEKYLYVYAWMEEEHIWATLTEHDAIIFHDNDFEIFVDPEGDGRNYSEIEVNAFNTTWDLILDKPYRLGGQANDYYELQDMLTAVHIEGTLNDPSDLDRYWAVEMAIPMESMLLAKHFGRKYPKDKDIWRLNFSRVEWHFDIQDGKYTRKKENGKYLPEMNWTWSPMGEINMHIPELWGYVQFSENTADDQTLFEKSTDEVSERVAYELFRRFKFGDLIHFTNQKTSFTKYIPAFSVENQRFNATYYKTAHGFEVEILNTSNNKRYLIDETGTLTKL